MVRSDCDEHARTTAPGHGRTAVRHLRQTSLNRRLRQAALRRSAAQGYTWVRPGLYNAVPTRRARCPSRIFTRKLLRPGTVALDYHTLNRRLLAQAASVSAYGES